MAVKTDNDFVLKCDHYWVILFVEDHFKFCCNNYDRSDLYRRILDNLVVREGILNITGVYDNVDFKFSVM